MALEKSVVSRGVAFINVTPHPITLRWSDTEEEFSVPPSGVVINATPVEEEAGVHPSGARLVRTIFRAGEADKAKLFAIEVEKAPADLIIGSFIAAQAFPGRIVCMIPAPGYERVAPAEKRMRADKFTVF